jgi:CRP/FNR family transcriptional regulator
MAKFPDFEPPVLHCDAPTRRDSECRRCVVRERMLFADIDLDAAAPLLRSVRHTLHRAGSILYRQGDPPLCVYSIRSGVLKMSLTSPEGNERIVRLAGPGMTIGLEALVGETYQHTGECLSAADVCQIPVKSINQLAIEQPHLSKRLMAQWQAQLARADAHLLDLSSGPVRERVKKLLGMIDTLCREGETDFILPSNPDCAALVAARVESVSRVMAELKRTGFLRRNTAGNWVPG